MDFPQQIEETLVDRAPTNYDVVMESPLYAANRSSSGVFISTNAVAFLNRTDTAGSNLNYLDKMSASMNSTLDDTTPSDSGIQMLDSESSELMVESITSITGFDLDDSAKGAGGVLAVAAAPSAPSAQRKEEPLIVTAAEETTVMDNNSNVTTIPNVAVLQNSSAGAAEETMMASQCSTFDTTENIVYRRKVRKPAAAAKAPKKRVSFHEDILKNTRTDNIHIEHGFITYKSGGIRKMPQHMAQAGRYSWCSEGDKRDHGNQQLSHEDEDDEAVGGAAGGGNGTDAGAKRKRRVVYRNACSDVLDYGNSDIYDMNDTQVLNYDNSGVFEYIEKEGGVVEKKKTNLKPELYKCSCSSSNSSLDSDENDKNSNGQKYAQAKSSSCDCIGMSQANNNIIGDNCYYSEPNIDFNESPQRQKSVWNKEKKPKSSCLKKSNFQTSVIHEQDLTSRVKKFNVHDVNQLLDNSSKMIFGSLKSIFTMPLPERGVPEGSEDLQAVVECVPELEQATPEHKASAALAAAAAAAEKENQNPELAESPPLKAKPFLSKSLDGSKKQQPINKFVHNVDDQLRRKNEEELFAASRQNSDENKPDNKETLAAAAMPTPQLQRQQEFDVDDVVCSSSSQSTSAACSAANSAATSACAEPSMAAMGNTSAQANHPTTIFRNKFIINCESTVFEHTGVSYCYDSTSFNDLTNMEDSHGSIASLIEKDTPVALPEPENLKNSFISAPIAKTFSNFFRSFNNSGREKTPTTAATIKAGKKHEQESLRQKKRQDDAKELQQATESYFALKMPKKSEIPITPLASSTPTRTSKFPSTTSSSTISELTSNTSNSNAQIMSHQKSYTSLTSGIASGSSSTPRDSLAIAADLRGSVEKQSRHLPSPLKKRSTAGGAVASSNLILQQQQPQRYGSGSGGGGGGMSLPPQHETQMLSPDIFNAYMQARGGSGRDSKSTILSEEFDDILTITTTDTDKNDSDIVILDYPDLNDRQSIADYANLLRPPQQAAKTSLINRFLRNVTQKKILETSIQKNNFFAHKLRSEQKLLTGNLYVKGAKPKNLELIDDLNAEIAMELEMGSGVKSSSSPHHHHHHHKELESLDLDMPGDLSRFEMGIGEISVDVFAGVQLSNIIKDGQEQLMKVFKLYTGYSQEGYMTPVLVFLTDKTLYVTDLVRNCLCSKFVLSYKELDVILMGPFGNTVLLSNSNRDMQQVLLAGGPHFASGLVANLELCARRSGAILPAVGQLTLDHLAALQNFVRENSCVGKHDSWMYYAVVNMPGSALGEPGELEPLGPHAKGFLMHRRVREHMGNSKQQPWNPGYFLLKAGVLYMFNDSTQKIPSWAMALAECQGARRAVKAQRPHCFEIMLKDKMLLQLAAPDEYVASEWLQALLQSASGLFEMQEKHKTLGCTLVVTQNHLITLREDFSEPLRKLSDIEQDKVKEQQTSYDGLAAAAQCSINSNNKTEDDFNLYQPETGSLLSSAMSTPTRNTQRSCSSMNSTPTKLSQLSRSTTTCNTTLASSSLASNLTQSSTSTTTNSKKQQQQQYQQQLQQQQHSQQCSQMQQLATATGSYPPNTNINSTTTNTNPSPNRQSNMNSVYGKNSGLEILTCADIKEMTGIKIPSLNDTWWCILEFSCQEVRECSDDLVIFFAGSDEMQRFLRLLEQLWQSKNNGLFPITVLDDDDIIAEQCTLLYMDINRSWEPLLSAALGYPL